MSIRVMTWVWDHSRSKKSDRLVLLAIADCASDDGGNAYPSMAELMRKTGMSERGVQGCIGKLAGLGELAVARNGGPGGCNRYRVLMRTNTPAESAPPAGNAGGQEMRGAQKVRGQKLRPPAGNAGQPPQEMRGTPAESAPVTVLEPSLEPSVVLATRERVAENSPALRVVADPPTTKPVPRTTNELVAEWIDHCKKRPPGRTTGHVSKEIKTLIDEGIDPADVRAGLAEWHRRGLHPSVLPSVVNQVMNAAPAAASGPARPSTTDQRVAAGLALAAKYDALNAQNGHTAIEGATA